MGSPDPGRRARPRATLVVILVSVASFSLLQSMVLPALTTIQVEYDTSQVMVTWVLTANLLSATVATPLLGRAGDLLGKRRVFVFSLLALAVGSLAAAQAPTIELLIAARVLQGLGGGVVPLSLAILRDTLTTRLTQALTLVASLTALGFGCGIIVAGPLLQTLGFDWLFLLPMIATSAAAASSFVVIPRDPALTRGALPWIPGLFLAGWLLSLLLTVTQGRWWGWTAVTTIATGSAAVVLAIVWFVAELRRPVPLIDLRLMRTRGIWTANAVSGCMGFSLFAAIACLPQFLSAPPESGYGFAADASTVGLMLLPWSMGSFLAGFASAHLVPLVGSRWLIVSGSLLASASFVTLATLHSAPWHIYGSTSMLGIGAGLVFSSLALVVVTAAHPSQTAVATGVNANIRTLGGAIGSAVLATVITARVSPAGHPVESGYVGAFLILAVMMLVSAVLGCFVPSARAGRLPAERFAAEMAPISITDGLAGGARDCQYRRDRENDDRRVPETRQAKRAPIRPQLPRR
jgi:MFS family permease